MQPAKFFIAAVLFATAVPCTAQKVYTKNGSVSFFSKATLENISADNNEVVSLLDETTGDMQFSVIIKSFHFKKSLMEEHFNENYMESDKYPKASFKGKINNISAVNFKADGSYPVTVSGELTMHAVTKTISASGTIQIKSGVATANAAFKIKPADYKVVIPGIVKDNIAETLDITVTCQYNQKL